MTLDRPEQGMVIGAIVGSIWLAILAELSGLPLPPVLGVGTVGFLLGGLIGGLVGAWVGGKLT